MTSAAAIKRLRSKRATHYDGETGPMVTIVHRTMSGAVASTTGRVIAETSQEVAVMVRGTPVVIPVRRITRRTPHTVAVTGRA